jgi:hypothetical protein
MVSTYPRLCGRRSLLHAHPMSTASFFIGPALPRRGALRRAWCWRRRRSTGHGACAPRARWVRASRSRVGTGMTAPSLSRCRPCPRPCQKAARGPSVVGQSGGFRNAEEAGANPVANGYRAWTCARSLRTSRSAALSCASSSSASSRFRAGAPTCSMASDRRRFSTSSGIGRSATTEP